MPQVSVIIPTYNRAHLLSRAIKSALDQTFQDFEIIIVDDASTDDTDKLVASFHDSRIRYIQHEKNHGGGAARNSAIKQAQGDYLAFLDSDDEWLPDKLEKQMKLFNGTSKKIGLVAAGAVDIRNQIPYAYYIPKFRGDIFKRILIENCVGLTAIAVVRKECLDKAGLFDESLRGSEDWDLWIRIVQHYDVDFTPEILLRYYPQADSMIRHHADGVDAHRKIFKKYYHLFKTLPPPYRAARYYHEGFFFWWKRELRECCINFIKAVFLNPWLMFPLISYFFKKIRQRISGTSYPIDPLSGDLCQ
ncbi:MAG TPA: glycosyltransferase family 2 protein [Thermodesulfobacteriota bacterium]|jgi:glycosyltransferase involved in cell wall biosynthesis|nr:glycosyltransferase family 2 protein [Thermodesulfobacteriota bacterium]